MIDKAGLYLGIISSIISICGAVWSFFTLREVRKTKNEIFSKIGIAKFAEAEMHARDAIEECRKIAYADRSGGLKGINTATILMTVGKHYEILSKISHNIKPAKKAEYDKHLKIVKNQINKASDESRSDIGKLIRSFTTLYHNLLDITAFIDSLKQDELLR